MSGSRRPCFPERMNHRPPFDVGSRFGEPVRRIEVASRHRLGTLLRDALNQEERLAARCSRNDRALSRPGDGPSSHSSQVATERMVGVVGDIRAAAGVGERSDSSKRRGACTSTQATAAFLVIQAVSAASLAPKVMVLSDPTRRRIVPSCFSRRHPRVRRRVEPSALLPKWLPRSCFAELPGCSDGKVRFLRRGVCLPDAAYNHCMGQWAVLTGRTTQVDARRGGRESGPGL